MTRTQARAPARDNGLAAFDASWRELGDQLRTVLRERPIGEESGK
jgi:hypothetical protein